jgi:glycosyltransferase involved in cell wall biosynthesis
MRAVVDLEALRVRNCGLGQFSLSLGRALLAEAGDDVELSYFLRRTEHQYFQREGVALATATNLRRETYCAALRPLLRMLLSEPCDVWHMSNQNAKFWPLDPRTPMVLTIHDLNFLRERDPREVPHELAKLQAKVDRATAIATDSQFVEREIREHLHIGAREIRVIYCGVNLDTSEPATRPTFLPPGSFLFAIGEVVPKKNFHVLLDLIEELPDRLLVIAGNKSHPYAKEIEADIQRRELSARVFLPGQVSGGERRWLYENCEAFCFPSKTEGFGIPVIEAMSAGRPVFCSHATSLPEVAGPLGCYWHAYDQPHLLKVFHEGMNRFHSTPNCSDKLRAHAAQFTWQRAAQEYLDLYRSAAQRKKQKPMLVA